MATTTSPGSYPTLKVDHIADPYRFYAVPVIGFLVKVVMLIPAFVVLMVIAIVAWFATLINSFVVLFTAKYWEPAYRWNLRVMRYTNKLQLFMDGLTNKYPGFSATDDDPLMSLDLPMPSTSNRWFAFPIFGGIVRVLLLIPFIFWSQIVQSGASIGVFISFIPVLFSGKYPEATYELARDRQRLSMALSTYMAGLSDKYPDFKISWNHKGVKVALLIIGAIFGVFNFIYNGDDESSRRYKDMNDTQPYYQTDQMPSSDDFDYDSITPIDETTLQVQ